MPANENLSNIISLLVPEFEKSKCFLWGRFFQRPWTGVDAFYACLVYNSDMQVVHYTYLTRQASVVIQVLFCSKDRPLRLTNFTRIPAQNLDPACRTACISATTMKNIDAVVLD